MTENYNTQDPYSGQPNPPEAAPLNEFSTQQPVPASQGAVLSSDEPTTYGKHSAYGQRDSNSDTKDAARQEGQHLKNEASTSAENVKETAQQEAGNVADEAKAQASSLWHQVQRDVSDQAGNQQNRAARSVRAVSDDLAGIRRGEAPQDDITRNILSFADDKISAVADRLENAEPRDLVEDVRRFASRKPVTFLAIAAGVGLIAGRVTRGLTANKNDSGSAGQRSNQETNSPAAGQHYSAGAAANPVGYRPSVPPEARTHESDAQTYGGDATGYAEYGIPETGGHTRPGVPGDTQFPEGGEYNR